MEVAMTKNVKPKPSLAETKGEIADAELDKVSGGGKTKTTSRTPSVSEIVVTKVIDASSPLL
jgi:type VI protein secretion system component Hcp